MSTWGPTQIAADGDDAAQGGGVFYLSGVDADGSYIMYQTTGWDFHCGWRFPNVTIPKGATIVTVTLEMYIHSRGGTFPRSADFFCEDADNPAGFTGAGDGPAMRTKTTASTRLTYDAAPAIGWASPDNLKDEVQEVIDRDGWASGNALVIISEEVNSADNGNVQIQDYGRTPAESGKLTIEYTTGGGPSTPDVPTRTDYRLLRSRR